MHAVSQASSPTELRLRHCTHMHIHMHMFTTASKIEANVQWRCPVVFLLYCCRGPHFSAGLQLHKNVAVPVNFTIKEKKKN